MNSTIDKVLELESRFEMYGDCTTSCVFYAPKEEMDYAAKYLGCHLYHPFELAKTEDFNYYFFVFKSERNKKVSIEVRSNEIHRLETKIVEI